MSFRSSIRIYYCKPWWYCIFEHLEKSVIGKSRKRAFDFHETFTSVLCYMLHEWTQKSSPKTYNPPWKGIVDTRYLGSWYQRKRRWFSCFWRRKIKICWKTQYVKNVPRNRTIEQYKCSTPYWAAWTNLDHSKPSLFIRSFWW